VAGGDELLVAAEKLAQAAFGAGAFHGVAYGGVRGDDGEARDFGGNRNIRRGRGLVRGALVMPKYKAAAIIAAAIFTQVAEIALPPDMLFGAETHDNGLPVARFVRRRSAVCARRGDGWRELCVPIWLICGRENLSGGRAFCDVGGMLVA